MTLQEIQANAKLLEQPYTNRQLMNKATSDFKDEYERSAAKAEMRWSAKPEADHTWAHIKQFWKMEIHQFAAFTAKRHANHVQTQVDSITHQMEALQSGMTDLQLVENQSYRKANAALTCQIQFHQTYQANG